MKRTYVRIEITPEQKQFLESFGFGAQQAVGRILIDGLIDSAKATGLQTAADRDRLEGLATVMARTPHRSNAQEV